VAVCGDYRERSRRYVALFERRAGPKTGGCGKDPFSVARACTLVAFHEGSAASREISYHSRMRAEYGIEVTAEVKFGVRR